MAVVILANTAPAGSETSEMAPLAKALGLRTTRSRPGWVGVEVEVGEAVAAGAVGVGGTAMGILTDRQTEQMERELEGNGVERE